MPIMPTFTMPKPTLGDLPEELLLGILEQVGSRIDEEYLPNTIRTFHSLSATSRKFHRLTEPYLYSTIKTDSFHYVKLLQRLEDNPTLIRYIKQLVWDGEPRSRYSDWQGTVPCLYEAPRLARKFNIPSIQDYLACRPWGNPCDVLTLILLLTPRLKALEITDPGLKMNSWSERFLQPFWLKLEDTNRHFSPNLYESFSSIRTIRFGDGATSLGWLINLLRLPALRILSFKGDFDVESDPFYIKRLAAFPPRSSLIEDLCIEDNRIHSKTVAMILRCIKSVKGFHLTFIENRRGDVKYLQQERRRILAEYGTPTLHYPTLIRAIMMHAESLESLKIHSDSSLEPQLYYTAGAGCLHLRRLRNLQYLSTDVVTLYRDETTNPERKCALFNTLPPSIRQLDLDMYEPVWPYFRDPKPALLSLAMSCSHKYPLLKEIGIVRKRGSRWASRTAFREIKDVFQSQGVAFKFSECII